MGDDWQEPSTNRGPLNSTELSTALPLHSFLWWYLIHLNNHVKIFGSNILRRHQFGEGAQGKQLSFCFKPILPLALSLWSILASGSYVNRRSSRKCIATKGWWPSPNQVDPGHEVAGNQVKLNLPVKEFLAARCLHGSSLLWGERK